MYVYLYLLVFNCVPLKIDTQVLHYLFNIEISLPQLEREYSMEGLRSSSTTHGLEVANSIANLNELLKYWIISNLTLEILANFALAELRNAQSL